MRVLKKLTFDNEFGESMSQIILLVTPIIILKGTTVMPRQKKITGSGFRIP